MVSARSPLADYLRARRALLQPADAGLASVGRRRVPGLRREEVARLAGISSDYYLRIEQGREQSPSDHVLSALARALGLDDGERSYLYRLARPQPLRPSLHAEPQTVSPQVLRLLDYWSHTPAYVFDRNHYILASNQLMRTMAPGTMEPGTNLVLDTFERYAYAQAQESSPQILAAWQSVLDSMVAALRFYSHPDDPRLHELVACLTANHGSFRPTWARHEARPHTAGAVRMQIAPLGWVEFRWQVLELAMAPGQYVVTHLAEPGSQAAAAVAYLVSLQPPERPSVRADLLSP